MSRQKTDGLTPRQCDTLNAIVKLKGAKGYPPSQSEIAGELSINGLAAVRHHIAELCRKGYLEHDFNIQRGLRVLKTAPVFSK